MNSPLSLLMPSLKSPAGTAESVTPATEGTLATLFAGVLTALDQALPAANAESLRTQVSSLLTALPEEMAATAALPEAAEETVQEALAAIQALLVPPPETLPVGKQVSAAVAEAGASHPGAMAVPLLPTRPTPLQIMQSFAGQEVSAQVPAQMLETPQPAPPVSTSPLALPILQQIDAAISSLSQWSVPASAKPAPTTTPAVTDTLPDQAESAPRPATVLPTHLALATALKSAQADARPGLVSSSASPAVSVPAPAPAPDMPMPNGHSATPPVAMASTLTTAAAPTTSATVSIPVPMHQTQAFSEAFGLHLTRLATQGTQQAQVHVNPQALGPISVRIVMQGQQAQIDFQARSAQTADLLEQMMPRLVASLEVQGIRLDDARVQVMSAADAQSFAQQFGRQDGQGESARARRSEPESESPSAGQASVSDSPPTAAAAPAPGRIDYYA